MSKSAAQIYGVAGALGCPLTGLIAGLLVWSGHAPTCQAASAPFGGVSSPLPTFRDCASFAVFGPYYSQGETVKTFLAMCTGWGYVLTALAVVVALFTGEA